MHIISVPYKSALVEIMTSHNEIKRDTHLAIKLKPNTFCPSQKTLKKVQTSKSTERRKALPKPLHPFSEALGDALDWQSAYILRNYLSPSTDGVHPYHCATRQKTVGIGKHK